MRSVANFATGSLLASVASAQVVQWDIAKRANPAPRLSRRADGTVVEIISNDATRGGYFASCTVGSPPQSLTLQLDTGSSDIWVPANSADVCAQISRENPGCTLGSYDADKSSTAVLINQDFSIRYVDGSHSNGDYIAETFSIGDVTLDNVTMGLGLDTDIAYGLLGIGYVSNEASVAQTGQIYQNLPLVMRDEGHIATNGYSLWLNDLDSSKGSIMFGGIDTDKYTGNLIRVNVQKDPRAGRFTSFILELTSLAAHSSSGDDSLSSRSFPVPVVLDSGTTFSYIPQDLAEEVWKEVGAVYQPIAPNSESAPLVPCSLANKEGYFAFGFGGPGGPVIQVGLDELVFPIFTGRPITFESGPFRGEDQCMFGIQNTSGSPFLLGDTMLRSAYVVYDLENNEIALAPTKFNATTSNIVPFASKGATIPSSTPAPNQGSSGSDQSGSGPDFNALGGFTLNAGSRPLPIDFTQMVVMGSSFCLMMMGGMFILF
ncbi:aspartic peptidase domain-containing protein [Xylaria nigripes]|nr:aspartic peptidase domain-containing protein [Xylaria nigripes]